MPSSSAHGSSRGLTARRHVDPLEIATRLAPAIRWPGVPEVGERSWRLLALTAEFDAWVIAWPCGGRIELHDHGPSRGAFVVLEGSLVESTPWRDDTGRLMLEHRDLGFGTARRFAPGHVHDVRNVSESVALSLHVYAPPLISMTHYELADTQLIPRHVRRRHEWEGGSVSDAPQAESAVSCAG